MKEKKLKIFQMVSEIIKDHMGRFDGKDISINDSLINDLGMDSIDLVEFALDLEDELEFSISESDIAFMETVGDVVEYIMTKMKNE